MSNEVLSSVEEAQAVYQKHAVQQEKEGWGRDPQAWVSVCKKRLVVVVRAYKNEGILMKPYEYKLDFDCAGIHEITAAPKRKKAPGLRKRKADGAGRPLRQLHMFKPG